MTFGTRLRDWIKHSPYTQRDIARITGVTTVTISNYLNGSFQPKKEFLEKLSELGADVGYLINGVATVSAKEEQSSETTESPDLRLRLLETENKYLREKVEIYEQYLNLDKPKEYNFEVLPAVAATPPKQ